MDSDKLNNQEKSIANSEAKEGEKSSEISAATIARMMGLATNTDLKLLTTKLDLVIGRVNALSTRIERIINMLGQAPTGSDLDRIDVQISNLRNLFRELLTGTAITPQPEKKEGPEADAEGEGPEAQASKN